MLSWIVWLIVAAVLGVAELLTTTLAFGLIAVAAVVAAVIGARWQLIAFAAPLLGVLCFVDLGRNLSAAEQQLLEALAIPIQQVMAEISGEEGSLAALRGLWALLHGFMLLELSGQFRRGGDLEAAFVQSVEAYLNGWCQEKN